MSFRITFRGNGKKNLLLGLILLTILSDAFAQTTTFTNDLGNGGHIWNIAANWDSGLPDPSATAVIPAGPGSGQEFYITNSTAVPDDLETHSN